jgi:hypothetical protein
VVQVNGGSSPGAVVPQKAQVTGTCPAYAAGRAPGSAVAAGGPAWS